MLPSSLAGVADVEVLGAGGVPALLVEVPHGADRADYDALRPRLAGELPADLHEFFHVNTDTGAWDYGRRAAELWVAADPRRTALLVRCRIPRTFIDTNRLEDAEAGAGLTAGVPGYVRDDADRALLLDLHRRYVALADEAYAALAPGGHALVPHTYGPVTLGIERVDETIVTELRRAHEPDKLATWPVRPEVDLITRTADGTLLAPATVIDEVERRLGWAGITVAENKTYCMSPATQGYRFATRYPGRVFCLEVRRDLLVERWNWNAPSVVDPVKVERFAAPLAATYDALLR